MTFEPEKEAAGMRVAEALAKYGRGGKRSMRKVS